MGTAEGIAEIYVAIYPEEEEEAEDGITEYFEYYSEAMNMLRNPTCEDSDVSYDVTPCTEGDDTSSDGGDGDACDGLTGKQLTICNRKQKKGKGGKGKGGKGKGGKRKGRKERKEETNRHKSL